MIASKSIVLFPVCALFLAACGKKATQGGTEKANVAIENTLPSSIVLESSASASEHSVAMSYTFQKDGDITLPFIIRSLEGSLDNLRVRLDVNVDNGDHEFHCYWKGRGASYEYENCFSEDGRNLSITPAQLSILTFPVDQGKGLNLTIEGVPSFGTSTAQISVPTEWK